MPESPPGGRISYGDAGVDLRAAEELTGRLKEIVGSTRTADTDGEFGSFGGRFRLPAATELVASADGVGTKVLVAAAAGIHDTVGEDLVNHCVNDILAEGAEPLFFLDYFACGRLDPDVAEAVIAGVARGCRGNGCALIGGETAEMPGVYEPGHYDLAGFIVGRRVWDLPGRAGVEAGDRLIGLASSGLHTNGYSLARKVLFDRLGVGPHDPFPFSAAARGAVADADAPSVADVLLRVHRSYLAALRPALDAGAVRALAHITGGGIPGNLRRALPEGLEAVVDVGAWEPPPEFGVLADSAGLAGRELYEALNMGVGMIVVAAPERAAEVREAAGAMGLAAFDLGDVRPGAGEVCLAGV
ncbi:MAG TPA: phosphoribosylformylglycinamidine cyclo-ligase [Gemmatimonadota bacterium]|nr:phosphoribosylformylglycinamidine cyclo-ligase [Gemmatimonadota bacterium]